jgi:hypothetical protein
MLLALIEWQRQFDAHDTQEFFSTHVWIPVLVIMLYFLLVWAGPQLMAARPPFKLHMLCRAWNVFVAIFSACGCYTVVPHLLSQLGRHGFWYTCCADIYELAGHGAPALWAALFTWSKLLELFDTALLILRKRPLLLLHWFHHASVIAFAWSAWIYETPLALWYGAMNFSVHSIMYTYFFLTSTRLRRRVLRLAPLITSLQISQFAWGTVVNVYAAALWANRQRGRGCSIHPNILLIGAGMYVAYGALFVRLFMHRYVSVPHRTSRRPQ